MELKVYQVKLKIGDKIYFVFGNPKHQIIYSAFISRIVISKNKSMMYNFEDAKLVHTNKLAVAIDNPIISKKNGIDFGFFYDNNLDSKIPNGNIRIFSSKDKCINYLKEIKNG